MIPCWRTKIPHTTRVQPKIKNLITGVEIKNVKQFLTVMIVLKVGTKVAFALRNVLGCSVQGVPCITKWLKTFHKQYAYVCAC